MTIEIEAGASQSQCSMKFSRVHAVFGGLNKSVGWLDRLRKKWILSLREFHGCGAFFVVVSHVIDPRAHGIATHQASIIRPQ
jgi:hypothetical protein